MALSPHKLYTAIAPHVTDPATQRTLCERALAGKDDSLLVLLLSNSNLDAEVDDRIATRTTTRVLTAWLTREGRATSDIVAMLQHARSETARASIAEIPDLPHSVYEHLAGVEQFRVAAALIQNGSVPEQVRRTAVETYAAGYPSANKVMQHKNEIGPVLGQRPEFAELVARHARQIVPANWALSTATMAGDVVAGLIDRVLKPALGDPGAYYFGVVTLAERLLQQPLLPPAERDRVLAMYELAVTGRDQLTSSFPRLVQIHAEAPSVRLPSFGNPKLQQMSDAATTAEMAACVQLALADGSDELAAELIRNRRCEPHTARKVVDLLTAAAAEEVALTRAGDPEVAAIVLIAKVDNWRMGAVIDAAPEPSAVLDAAAREWLSVHPDRELPSALLVSEHLTAQTLKLHGLDDVLSTYNEQARVILAELVAATFSTVEHYHVFDKLAATFTGNVGELLDMCALVAANTDA